MATIINATFDRITAEGKPDDLLSLWLRITDEIIDKDSAASLVSPPDIAVYMADCLLKGYVQGAEISYGRTLTDLERKAWREE